MKSPSRPRPPDERSDTTPGDLVSRLERGEHPEAHHGHDRRGKGVEQQAHRTDALLSEALLQDAVASGVGRVGDDREATSCDRSRDQSVLGSIRESLDQRPQVRQGRVVRDGREASRAQEERERVHLAEQGLQPPTLEAAERHQAGQEEPDQQAALEVELLLVLTGHLDEAQEEQEETQEEDHVVGVEDDPTHEDDVDHVQPHRHLHETTGRLLGRHQRSQLLLQHSRHHGRVDDDRDGCLPAEVHGHVFHAPSPLACHHENRRRSEVRQGATDGDVDEQDAERGVLESLGHVPGVVAVQEDERGHRHGGRLSDERPQQGAEDQGGQVERGLVVHREELGGASDDVPCELDNRPRRCHRHDDKHERRLGVVPALKVGDRPVVARHDDDSGDQSRRPKPKHHLDLTEEVEEVLGDGAFRVLVGQVLEALDREGVDDREPEQDRGDQLHRVVGVELPTTACQSE